MSFNRLLPNMKAALRTVLGTAAHRRGNSAPKPGFRPWAEVLEDRTTPSTINWINRGSTAVDLDGFNSVFRSGATAARAVVDAAIASWERSIVLFNQPFGGNTLNVTIGMSALGTGWGGVAIADASPLTMVDPIIWNAMCNAFSVVGKYGVVDPGCARCASDSGLCYSTLSAL